MILSIRSDFQMSWPLCPLLATLSVFDQGGCTLAQHRKCTNLWPVLKTCTGYFKYWRRYKKVRFETKRNVTYYVDNDIRAMVERQSRAKKRIRYQWVKKKLATINVMVGILVVSAGICFVYFMDPFTKNTLSKFEVFLPFMAIFIFAFIYWTVRLIQYLWKISFRKNGNTK